MCELEERNQYKLHMTPGALVSWMVHNVNISKKEDALIWRNYLMDLGILEKQFIEKEQLQKEIDEAYRNTAWLKKPMKFQAIRLGTEKPKTPNIPKRKRRVFHSGGSGL